MEKDNLGPSSPKAVSSTASTTVPPPPNVQSPTDVEDAGDTFPDDYYGIDSNCSTPYVSAPSSPGRTLPSAGGGGGGGGCYFYSAPASPMHFVSSKAAASSARTSGFVPSPSDASSTGTSGSFEFRFSAWLTSTNSSETMAEIGFMSSADELFLNGQIRPMKLSSHLQRPQFLVPLIDIAESDGDGKDKEKGEGDGDDDSDVFRRSRELRLRDKSLRRRARSMSPMRNTTTSFDWCEHTAKSEENGKLKLDEMANMMLKAQQQSMDGDGEGRKGEAATDEGVSADTTPSSASASSSRCSSAGRSSKRWVFLKDFLRSKSEGRNNGKFWSNISFSPAKEKKSSTSSQHTQQPLSPPANDSKDKAEASGTALEARKPAKKASNKLAQPPMNGMRMGKRRVPPSAHELHYTVNRAQAEEMRKKTYLPYRQGLFGCLGFSSKSYGAMNGFARALNPVSSS